jgi:hypothetical protein
VHSELSKGLKRNKWRLHYPKEPMRERKTSLWQEEIPKGINNRVVGIERFSKARRETSRERDPFTGQHPRDMRSSGLAKTSCS